MPPVYSSRLLLLVVALIGCTLGGLAAAPILKRPKVFEELRAFADIPRLQLEVDPIPKELADVDLSRTRIRNRIKVALAEAGIRVTDDTFAPKLHVKAATMVDERYPDAVGFILIFDLVEMTRIVRLDEELLLATATIPLYAIKPKTDLARAFRMAVDDGANRVRVAIQIASDERERGHRGRPDD